jgi:hypothetical protein
VLFHDFERIGFAVGREEASNNIKGSPLPVGLADYKLFDLGESVSIQEKSVRCSGILHRFNGTWGIIFCPGGGKYFYHTSGTRSGQPQNGARCSFDIGPPRSPAELPMAIGVDFIAIAPDIQVQS